MDFLLTNTSQDCINLQEFTGEVHGGNNQDFVSIEDLIFVQKLIEVFEGLNNIDYEKELKNKFNDEFEKNLNKFIKGFQKYKDFFNEKLNQNKFNSEIIQKILNQSEFFLMNSNINIFNARYKNSIKEDKIIYNELGYEQLIELRDRALSNRYKIKDIKFLNEQTKDINNFIEQEKIIINNSEYFIELVHQINEILKILNQLSNKGFIYYFLDEEIINYNNKEKLENDLIKKHFDKIEEIQNSLLIKIKVIILKNDNSYLMKYFFCQEKEPKNFEEIYGLIKGIYRNIVDIQKKAYLNKRYINFIYGKQFQLFFDYFLNKKLNENLLYYLSYFCNREKIENINLDKLELESLEHEDIFQFYQNFIDNCEIFLENILKLNNSISFEDIYQQNYTKDEFRDLCGIYLDGNNNIETGILKRYKEITNNFPLASTLLLCNKDTTSEEIIAFLYRSILCDYNVLFCIARTEDLTKEKKSIILETIIELYKKKNKMKSCLLIMNIHLNDDLCKSLLRLKFINLLNIKEKQINKKPFADQINNFMIIYSDTSGIGKSTYIRNKKRNNLNEYIYFPVGGKFSKDETLKRFQKLNQEKELNKKDNFLLHIDLYDTDEELLMNDFLYFILITKLYGQGNNIFYLSKSIQLYVEIPNSFINFFDKFPVLKIFNEKNKKHLNSANLEPLIVPDDIYSNERFVALYLKLLKEKDKKNPKRNRIDVKTIVFPDTPEDIICPDKNVEEYYKSLIINAEDENKELTRERCQELIFEELNNSVIKNNGEVLKASKITYYQITTFINILAEQLKKFNINRILSASTIIDNEGLEEKCFIRSLIIKNLIKISSIFSKGSFTQLVNEQDEAQNLIKKKITKNEKINEANQYIENFKHEPISFYLIDFAFILFHGGDNSSFFTTITNKKKSDKDYINLLDFINMQSLKKVSNQINIKEEDEIKKEKYLESYNEDFVFQLKDFTKYSNEEFLKELGEILGIKNSIKEMQNNISENYEFTADNFFKLCLIILRIRANIPIILMGETGCGKTSLIQTLSQLQNNGEKKKLDVENIHAGHNDKDIINFIEKIIPKAEELLKEQQDIKEKYIKAGETYEEKKLLVFFDELNTCKSMDLLSEIICKNSCQGRPLPKNIAFIGAANPYRKTRKKNVGLKIYKDYNNYDETDLVYNVNPMPHSLLNYVLDFGSLSQNDEEKYIKKMISKVIKENNFLDFASEMITRAQNIIRESFGISSVSLREVERFRIFYKFFLNYLNKRKEFEKNKIFRQDVDYSELDEELIQLISINLSIYLGYYLRLSDYDDENNGATRQNLSQKLDELFKPKLEEFKHKLIKVCKNNNLDVNFLFFPELEENFIADNLELDKGIAKNRALLENLFSLFVGVNTKIPIFIIGKPGSSKSLSVKLISKVMNKKENINSFFAMFNKMHITTYQGSLNSTSKEVEKTFENAREFLKIKDNDKKISVIFIEEMGLAEHSPHNPLKVIHKELDRNNYENEDDKIAFIGISNWTFDSSKINRGVTINIPDSSEIDMKKTSKTIAESYLGTNLKDNKILSLFFDNLASTYYKYKLVFKEDNKIRKYENFHGKRDFYHLIKYSASKIKELLDNNIFSNNQIIIEQKLMEIAIKSLGRNFGGLELRERYNSTGLKLIIDKFIECNYNNLELKNLINNSNLYNEIKVKINDNLKEKMQDYLSRYILLITKCNIGIYLLSSFLNSDKKLNNYTIIIGSKFKDDLNKIEYSSKILSKIKMNLEKDSILVLKDLDTIYPSLYELFNQNFLTIQGKNFTRIALNRTNSFSQVNNNFRCIIIVDENKLIYQEIPFLSRFEKQNLSFEYLMNEKQKSQSKNIFKKCQKLVEYDKNWKLINYDLNSLLINCGEEEINGIVYLENSDRIEDIIAEKISSTLPQDIILILSKMIQLRNDKDNYEFYNKILNYYNKNRYNNIKSLLKSRSLLKSNKLYNNKIVIYTFTRIIENIKTETDKNIKELKILSLKNELEFEEEIKEFLENNELEFFILKFTPNEFAYIDYFKILNRKFRKYISK